MGMRFRQKPVTTYPKQPPIRGDGKGGRKQMGMMLHKSDTILGILEPKKLCSKVMCI